MPHVTVICTDFFFFTLVVLSGQWRILTRTCVEIVGGGREIGWTFSEHSFDRPQFMGAFLVLVYDVIGTIADGFDCGR